MLVDLVDFGEEAIYHRGLVEVPLFLKPIVWHIILENVAKNGNFTKKYELYELWVVSKTF